MQQYGHCRELHTQGRIYNLNKVALTLLRKHQYICFILAACYHIDYVNSWSGHFRRLTNERTAVNKHRDWIAYYAEIDDLESRLLK